jgi:formate/nitrite transporter FocA (FNT family)
MNRIKTFVYAIAAGVCIGIGGTVYLSLDNKLVGSALFTIGLFMVCTHGLNLFTGKVCYVLEKDKSYAIDIPIIWLGNLVGTWLMANLMNLTRIGPGIAEKAAGLCQIKLGDELLSIFILAIFCNVMIWVGVDAYLRHPHELGKYVGLFLCIMVFILSGFEHCVANMFYFSLAGAWSGKAVLYLMVMTVGNAVGGVMFPLLRQWKNKEKQTA